MLLLLLLLSLLLVYNRLVKGTKLLHKTCVESILGVFYVKQVVDDSRFTRRPRTDDQYNRLGIDFSSWNEHILYYLWIYVTSFNILHSVIRSDLPTINVRLSGSSEAILTYYKYLGYWYKSSTKSTTHTHYTKTVSPVASCSTNYTIPVKVWLHHCWPSGSTALEHSNQSKVRLGMCVTL